MCDLFEWGKLADPSYYCNNSFIVKNAEISLLPIPRESSDPDRDLAGALHEVSNSLTVVLGWLDRAAEDPTSVRKALRVARAQALLGYRVARRAIGAEVADDAPYNAAEVSTRALDAVRCEADRKHVELELVPACSAGSPVLDSAQVAQQILLNLLLNAIAFTPPQATVRLSWRTKGAFVAFSVRDEGPGIEAERAATILSGPPSTRPGGAGIGLSHSVELARAHGAELMLTHAGPGASFELRWPIGEARSAARHSDIGPVVLEQRKVLILEDDSNVAELLTLSFGARGADAVVASSLEELAALPEGQRRGADVVLVDLSPLSKDVAKGLELVSMLVASAPIVLVTGRADPLPPGTENLVAAWVRKPFDMDDLYRVLHDVING